MKKPGFVFPLLGFLLLLSIQFSCTQEAQLNNMEEPSAEELTRVSYMSEATGEERDYFVYLPKGYHSQPDKKWPVMLFLHGNGERGDAKEELDFVTVHGPLYEAWVQKRDLPFIIVVPQLPMYGMDTLADYIRDRKIADIPRRLKEGVPERPDGFPTPYPMTGEVEEQDIPTPPEGPRVGWFKLEEDLMKMVDHTLTNYRTDADRLYLTGISYGGFGSWFFASRHPELFAAMVPVVGYGHPDLMEPIVREQLPVWVFAGGRDRVVQPKFFYPGLNKLESLGHENLRFTIHADMGHDAWVRVYAGQDIYDWMLMHRRGK